MKMKPLSIERIGLTMRVDQAPESSEWRDALAQDWSEFMAYALPEVAWMPLPNLGSKVIDFARRWKLDGFILTGGNDVGACRIKDETDYALLKHAEAGNIPVYGVCRGLQVIQKYHGGKLEACPSSEHVAKQHQVSFAGNFNVRSLANRTKTVNSFHNWGMRLSELSPALAPLAVMDGDWVEAAHAKQGRAIAVMWHPERQRPFQDFDRDLIRYAFGLEDPVTQFP